MSNINLNWLKNNINVTHPIIFDIGCADMQDSIMFKTQIENSSVYAFECADVWKEQNLIKAKENNINYFHTAISGNDTPVVFYPSGKLKSEAWPWSGSIFEPSKFLLTDDWSWEDPYTVDSISLNSLCAKYNIKPDFIHIDVQGAEYDIFKNINNDFKPPIIWAEISEFHMYNTGVTYQNFKELLESHGYVEHYTSNNDALYILATLTVAPYI